MSIEKLIDKYLKQTQICAKTDYAEKKSVRKHNAAANEMFRIIKIIAEKNDASEIQKFTELLNVSENRTNIWLAPQVLEKMNVDKKTEKKALEIIEKVANGKDEVEAMTFRMWLKDYNNGK